MDGILIISAAVLVFGWLAFRVLRFFFGRRRMMPPSTIKPSSGGSLIKRCSEVWLSDGPGSALR